MQVRAERGGGRSSGSLTSFITQQVSCKNGWIPLTGETPLVSTHVTVAVAIQRTCVRHMRYDMFTPARRRGVGLLMPEDEALYFFRQLVNAVDYCHRCVNICGRAP